MVKKHQNVANDRYMLIRGVCHFSNAWNSSGESRDVELSPTRSLGGRAWRVIWLALRDSCTTQAEAMIEMSKRATRCGPEAQVGEPLNSNL